MPAAPFVRVAPVGETQQGRSSCIFSLLAEISHKIHFIIFGMECMEQPKYEIIDHFGSLNLSMMNKVILLLSKLDLDVASINAGPPVGL